MKNNSLTIFAKVALVAAVTLAAQSAWAQYVSTTAFDTTTLGVTTFDDARINTSGTLAFRAQTGALAATSSYFVGGTRLLGFGDATPYGSTYTALDGVSYAFNDAGDLMFRNAVAIGAGVVAADNTGVFRYNAATGTTVTLAREGTTNLPGATTATAFGTYDLNNNGQSVIAANRTGTGAFSGIYGESGGTLTQFARSGQSAPGTASGTYSNLSFSSTDLDDLGNVSFRAQLLDLVAGDGVFTRTAATGTVSAIAVGGDAAPGITGGVFSSFLTIARSDNGATAFVGNAGLFGQPTTRGLWTQPTPGGAISLLALAGGTFGSQFTIGNINDSGTGVFRTFAGGVDALYAFTGATLTKIAMTGDTINGEAITSFGTPFINNAGNVAYTYATAAREGIAVAALAPAVVPEPGTLALLGVGSLLGVGIVRRRNGAQG